MPPDLESRLDAEIMEAICRGVFSGASILISGGIRPDFERTWGTVESHGVPVTFSTRFDLASLTKPLITAPLCMAAVERGLLDLDDPLSRFFPGSVPAAKEEITVRSLLSHSSGLPAYKPFYLDLIKLPPEARQNTLASMILQTPLETPPGKTARYSDPGFMLLGLILERQMGGRLDGLARDYLFDPLGIDELHFCPLSSVLHPLSSVLRPQSSVLSFAATQLCPWRKRLIRGEADDKNAWTLNGVAGQAGLFGTARGVFKLLSFLWNVYEGNGADPLWTREIVRLFWTRANTAEGVSDWCLGYDTPSQNGYTSTGRYFSASSIGHLGFTGVSFWLDLEKKILVILLTNRVHPSRENDQIRQFRPVLHDIIMESLTGNNNGN